MCRLIDPPLSEFSWRKLLLPLVLFLQYLLRVIPHWLLDSVGRFSAMIFVWFWKGFFLVLGALLAITLLKGCAHAQTIPAEALRLRPDLVRAAHATWGLNAPVAVFAAQLHQESGWRADARSPVGARGLAQFMPATSRWIGEIYPELEGNAPLNPAWAIRALCIYDKHLFDRIQADSPAERIAMALSAYNGGLGWVYKDQRLATVHGYDSGRWWEHVERVNAGRGQAFWKENRGYPERILRKLEPLYVRAAYGPGLAALGER